MGFREHRGNTVCSPFRGHHGCESVRWTFFVACSHTGVTRATGRGTEPCPRVTEAKARGEGSPTQGGSSMLRQIGAKTQSNSAHNQQMAPSQPSSPAGYCLSSPRRPGPQGRPHSGLTSPPPPPGPGALQCIFPPRAPVRFAGLSLGASSSMSSA